MSSCPAQAIYIDAGVYKGIYSPTGTDAISGVAFTRFVKEGSLTGIPYIRATGGSVPGLPGLSTFNWSIIVNNALTGSVAYRTFSVTSLSFLSPCPPTTGWSPTLGFMNLPPLTLQYVSEGIGLDIARRNLSYSTPTEGGTNRFRRLASLGYV